VGQQDGWAGDAADHLRSLGVRVGVVGAIARDDDVAVWHQPHVRPDPGALPLEKSRSVQLTQARSAQARPGLGGINGLADQEEPDQGLEARPSGEPPLEDENLTRLCGQMLVGPKSRADAVSRITCRVQERSYAPQRRSVVP